MSKGGAKKAQAKSAIAVAPAIDPASGKVALNLFDGTRQTIQEGTQILLRITDGSQQQLYRKYVSAPNIDLTLPFHNNLADRYSFVVSGDEYYQSGFYPVQVSSTLHQILDLMMLKKGSTFDFSGAQWSDLMSKKPLVAQIFAASTDADPATVYERLSADHPDYLACLLNLTTAMQQIFLPAGTPLDYFKEFDLDALAPDRIFGYANSQLVDQVKAAAGQGEFQVQPPADLLLHPGATSSFKQIQFGEANVQLTFHEGMTKMIGGVACVYVEPDIDYYKDPAAHFFLEVLENALTHGTSNPKVVYLLRWMAGRRAGIPEFDPLYTIA